MLEILGLKGILAALGALAVAGFGLYVRLLQRKAASADAWRARAEGGERESAARADLAAGQARTGEETAAKLEELRRESARKQGEVERAESAEDISEGLRRGLGGGPPAP